MHISYPHLSFLHLIHHRESIKHPIFQDETQVFLLIRLLVEYYIFFHHRVLEAMNLMRQFGGEPEAKKKLYTVRRRLLGKAICHFRLILALYSLILFPPMTFFLRYRFYRSSFYYLERWVYSLAKYGDILHIYSNRED